MLTLQISVIASWGGRERASKATGMVPGAGYLCYSLLAAGD